MQCDEIQFELHFEKLKTTVQFGKLQTANHTAKIINRTLLVHVMRCERFMWFGCWGEHLKKYTSS